MIIRLECVFGFLFIKLNSRFLQVFYQDKKYLGKTLAEIWSLKMLKIKFISKIKILIQKYYIKVDLLSIGLWS